MEMYYKHSLRHHNHLALGAHSSYIIDHLITLTSTAACGVERRASKVANSLKNFGHISGINASTALDEVFPLTFSVIKV